jgi:hypothetical protein
MKFLFIYEPMAELGWGFLRYLDWRRKKLPIRDPYHKAWCYILYSIVGGYGPGELDHWEKI